MFKKLSLAYAMFATLPVFAANEKCALPKDIEPTQIEEVVGQMDQQTVDNQLNDCIPTKFKKQKKDQLQNKNVLEVAQYYEYTPAPIYQAEAAERRRMLMMLILLRSAQAQQERERERERERSCDYNYDTRYRSRY